MRSRLSRLLLVALLTAAPSLSSLAGAAETVWLCNPAAADNPCQPSLDTTLVSPAGKVRGVRRVHRPRYPKVDCFYVYPTVSDQPTGNANLEIDPVQRSVALYQAARYSEVCRVFAPMYRQVTVRALLGVAPGADSELAYADVRDAWRAYLQNENGGRGVVLIGHSQGTFVLRRLIAEEIDPDAAARAKLVSAILLGGNVTVAAGSDVGGDFQNVAACRSRRQLGCAVAFSTFNAPVPQNALFGRAGSGRQVLCTNPASLRGGPVKVRSILPTAPFAPGSLIGASTLAVGFTVPAVSTPWIEIDGAYEAECSSADDANVLHLSPAPGAPLLNPVPDASWGLHIVDANIALGDLTRLVRSQASAFVRKRHCRFRRGAGWSGCRS